MVASEGQPYAKTGGLADVVAALPSALVALGHAVTVVMPRYREVGRPAGRSRDARITMGAVGYDVTFTEVEHADGVRFVFVGCDPLYDRPGLYGDETGDHADNALRFGLLSHAALAWANRCEPTPSVVHAHDWQAGLVPALLRTGDGRLAATPSVFTIHNLAYQGLFPPETLDTLGLDDGLYSIDGLEFWGQVSFLKGGIALADAVTTVSASYAREIMTPAQGEGLDGLLAHRRQVVTGITNGIDVDAWNPSTDPHLPAAYTAENLSGKVAAKRALLARYGLPSDATALARPLVGMVSRMVDQKGLDLIWDAREALAQSGAVFVVLGTGAPRYEAMWRELAAAHPDRFGVRIGFDEALAHLVEGGADLFLMPSRYEPCGLNQMYSMRYGTVPVVRATGGLADTVQPYDPTTGEGTGFSFRDYDATALLDTLRVALGVFETKARWRSIQQAGMRQDFSWNASAAAYVQQYRNAIERRRRAGDAGETREE